MLPGLPFLIRQPQVVQKVRLTASFSAKWRVLLTRLAARRTAKRVLLRKARSGEKSLIGRQCLEAALCWFAGKVLRHKS